MHKHIRRKTIVKKHGHGHGHGHGGHHHHHPEDDPKGSLKKILDIFGMEKIKCESKRKLEAKWAIHGT
jgi:hypothetical protein